MKALYATFIFQNSSYSCLCFSWYVVKAILKFGHDLCILGIKSFLLLVKKKVISRSLKSAYMHVYFSLFENFMPKNLNITKLENITVVYALCA